MIETPTTFILGAGASIPYRYPSGLSLLQMIVKEIQEGGDLRQCLKACGCADTQMVAFGDALKLSGRTSVDAFLEHRNEFIEVGKAAIAGILMRYEHVHDFYVADRNWYKYLFNLMCTSFDEFHRNPIGFITFNYDRSLEEFFYQCLKNSFNKSDAEICTAMGNIPIVHVHGQLCRLPWETNRDNRPVRRYEAVTSDVDAIKKSAQQIQIIHENGVTLNPEFARAKELLQTTKRIIFLGFGFHKSNMRRLGMERVGNTPRAYSSRFGVTNLEVSRLKHLYNGVNFLGLETNDVLDVLRNEIIV